MVTFSSSMWAVISAIAPGASYTSRLLIPTSRSSTMSSRPTPWAPARSFSSWMACSIDTFSPSIAIGTPASKVIVTSSGSRGTAGLAV